MQILVVLLSCAVCVLGNSKFVEWFTMTKSRTVKTKFPSYYHEWLVFKRTHSKVYGDMDKEQHRYEVFKSNLKKIEEHNKQYSLGLKSYSLGINQYSDMSHDEFLRYMHLDRLMQRKSKGSTFIPASNTDIPDTVDWREKGYVTPVKNQGQCGSCWSFSTTGSMEGQHFRKTTNLISLSEQQLVDCSGSYGDQGCDGGLMDYAFEYIQKYGSESEDDYPYEAKQHNTCSYQKSLVVANCTGHVDVESGSESKLKKAVANVGPVSVAIDASHPSFQQYQGGVYDEPECSSTRLDHGVLAVGYGTSDGGDYWLVKNSWGESWGEEGYVKMSRNKQNQCGIATQASYPLV